MTLHVPFDFAWQSAWDRATKLAPEAFGADRLRNLVAGRWSDVGHLAPLQTPVDGSDLTHLSKVDAGTASEAVAGAAQEHNEWARTSLGERKALVSAAVDALAEARDELALLLAWEIGKPWRLACADVDRCLDGVRWYLDAVDEMLSTDVEGAPFDREPLAGPVSNIASWNYPMSVLVHAELVQALAGNAVIAKTPTQGGAVTLTLAHALMRQAGLPVTLVSGSGAQLSDALVRSNAIGALAFVGGRSNGGKVDAKLVDTG